MLLLGVYGETSTGEVLMLIALPEIDCVLPARSVSVFTCHDEGMLKELLVFEFQTMYFGDPVAGVTVHCQVPSGVLEQVIDELSSQACTWLNAIAAGVGV